MPMWPFNRDKSATTASTPWTQEDKRKKRGAFYIAGIVISLGIVGAIFVYLLMK